MEKNVKEREQAGDALQLSKRGLAQAQVDLVRTLERLADADRSVEVAEISVNEKTTEVAELQKNYDEMWNTS